MRTRISGLIATLALSTLVLSGCANSQFGAAAVVDGERISVSTVEASVTGLMNQRRAAGEQDTGTVRNGQDARDQVRFHIVSVAIRQIAQARGITISAGEKSAARQQILQAVGGPEALLTALTQNQIAEADFALYIEDVLYQRKLGELLVPGAGAEVESRRNDAVQNLLKQKITKGKITVNPRYGVFDAQTGLIMTRESTNGAVTLPTE